MCFARSGSASDSLHVQAGIGTEAAAAFSDFVLLGLASTLPAAEAAFEPVWRVFRFTVDSPSVVVVNHHPERQIAVPRNVAGPPLRGWSVMAPSGCNRGASSFRRLPVGGRRAYVSAPNDEADTDYATGT